MVELSEARDPIAVCDCVDVCKIPAGQPQPLASCRGLENQTIPPAVSAKDEAYSERNRLVAALAHLYPSGIARTDIPGWEPEWHGCIYIDLPTGQASWHYHDREAHLFADLPPYQGKWDGHDTATKYERVSLLRAESAPTQRLYNALHAMMHGWEDDRVRLEAYAALKEAADWLGRQHGGTV